MIDRDEGCVAFYCDNCGDDFETGERDFSTALTLIKEAGWEVRRTGIDDWEHWCLLCQENEDRENDTPVARLW